MPRTLVLVTLPVPLLSAHAKAGGAAATEAAAVTAVPCFRRVMLYSAGVISKSSTAAAQAKAGEAAQAKEAARMRLEWLRKYSTTERQWQRN